jgi:catechol 2,3-dioxygenase-like lactoylglutathione lyase family enzyme
MTPTPSPGDVPDGFAQAALVPELLATDLDRSLDFWCRLCGFSVAYARPEDGFAYLHRGGAQMMLEEVAQPGRRWVTAALEPPLGRGVNFQIEVDDLASLHAALLREGWPFYLNVEEKWYRVGLSETGVRQFLVQDPDGYLLRFQQPLGTRPASA